MKRRLLPLLLAALMLLTGCASLLERSDVSATAHVDYSATEDASILRVESYSGLVNALLHFVGERTEEGTVRLYNYPGSVQADLAQACKEVMTKDPLGSFSLQDITYDSTRILTYYEVDLTFLYNRTDAELDAIREIVGISALQDQLAAMVAGQHTRLTLMASYFSGNEDLVWQLLTLARYARPDLYQDSGGAFDYEISFYPETGTRRIVDIRVDNWGAGHHTPAEQLEPYAQQLQQQATLLLEGAPPSGTTYTPEELVAVLRTAAGGYDYHGSSLADAVLSGVPANETGYMLALEYLCQLTGIEVIPVFSPPHSWLIVATEDGYRHLLPSDIFSGCPPREEGDPPYTPEELRSIALYTDEELEARGFRWNRSLHPVCEGSEDPLPEDVPPDAQEPPEASGAPETEE